MPILIDTSFLLASAWSQDKNHAVAKGFLRTLVRSGERVIVLLPVVMELFFITKVRVNQDRAVAFVENVLRQYPISQLVDEDLHRMLIIEKLYHDAKLDFTDASIMAVSERLNITRIATFDRRDFDIYRPSHTDHYELLP